MNKSKCSLCDGNGYGLVCKYGGTQRRFDKEIYVKYQGKKARADGRKTL